MRLVHVPLVSVVHCISVADVHVVQTYTNFDPALLSLPTISSYLDRSNIGNAYTGGMGKDLNMSPNHYSIVLLVFFATYVTFEVPSNMLLTRVRPSIYLPTIMFLWGGLSIAFAAAKSWQAIAVLRVILGVLEAGFAPGVLFLLSSWYKKGELARRYSIYYSAVPLAGMFGGLIAGGLLKTLDGSNGMAGWRWLFIVEGAATCVVAIASVFILPDFPSTTKWLSPRERAIAGRRLAEDNVGSAQGGDEDISHNQAAKMAFTDWRTWCFVFLYMLTTGSQTIQKVSRSLHVRRANSNIGIDSASDFANMMSPPSFHPF